MDSKTDRFWFLCEPNILFRAASHTESCTWFSQQSVKRGVSEKWTRLCYPRVPVAPVVSCSYHVLRQRLQHALSTTPNGAHPGHHWASLLHTTRWVEVLKPLGASCKQWPWWYPSWLTSLYNSVIYESKSDQPGVKVFKDERMNTSDWKGLAKGNMMSTSDDSGDQLKVKFAKFASERWTSRLEDLKNTTRCSHGSGHQ